MRQALYISDYYCGSSESEFCPVYRLPGLIIILLSLAKEM